MLGPKQGWLFFSILLLHGLSDWAAVEVTGIFTKQLPSFQGFSNMTVFRWRSRPQTLDFVPNIVRELLAKDIKTDPVTAPSSTREGDHGLGETTAPGGAPTPCLPRLYQAFALVRGVREAFHQWWLISATTSSIAPARKPAGQW